MKKEQLTIKLRQVRKRNIRVTWEAKTEKPREKFKNKQIQVREKAVMEMGNELQLRTGGSGKWKTTEGQRKSK